MVKAMYPGGFDPITCGHMDIARRASILFDSVVVAVYDTPAKNLLFSAAERVALARQALAGSDNIEVVSYSILTVEFASQIGANVIVRGLRAISDFEMEMQLAHFNRRMLPEIDVVCLMTSLQYSFLSASMVKEIVRLGGPSEGLVPDFVAEEIRARTMARIGST
jgi:pantetheine-phosphate adenylyltransferase